MTDNTPEPVIEELATPADTDTPEPEKKLPLLAAPADIVTGFPVQAPTDDPDTIRTENGVIHRNLGRAGQPGL